jgi:hypothetical protein
VKFASKARTPALIIACLLGGYLVAQMKTDSPSLIDQFRRLTGPEAAPPNPRELLIMPTTAEPESTGWWGESAITRPNPQRRRSYR